MLRQVTLLFLFSLLPALLFAQYFVNNSFEGEPQDAFIPVGWHKCTPLTTPDILPGVWGVYQEPAEGSTFVGLITRNDGSYESIGQRFPKPLKAGQCYRITLFVAHSETYAGFNEVIRFRIWGGNEKCRRSELIYESVDVDHSDWKQYIIEYTPDSDLKYFILEAAFPDANKDSRGNVIFDYIDAIRKCDQV